MTDTSTPSQSLPAPRTGKHRHLLVLSQVYVPDPASVGQHMHDAAAEMASRGHIVHVICSGRGYDDPTQKYAPKETLDGVHIRRLPLSSFGKKSIPLRLLAGFLFMGQCMVRGMFTKADAILVSTSPPMCAAAALVISYIRRKPIVYWVMDLNPDQMVELGKLKPTSMVVRLYDFFNRRIFKRAREIVVMDRFMADRINKKIDVSHKVSIMPPWPHEGHLEVVAHEDNPFRREHNLSTDDNANAKFVIMYSGNHGFSTPVTTVLDAAVKMQDRENLKFYFIGGGVGKKDVKRTIEDHKPTNIADLPYQPLDSIKYSLSAADVHLVSVGDDVVGVVHPCKVYGAMAVARPILLLGPDPCHVSDVIRDHNIGWHIQHGDVDGAVKVIDEILHTSRETLIEMGQRARELVNTQFSATSLKGAFCDVVERVLVGNGN